MNKILIFLIVFLFSHCSFDNKSGIWQSKDSISKKDDRFKGFEKFYTKLESYKEVKYPKLNLKISIDSPRINNNWTDEHYQRNNNLINFSYKDLNKVISSSKKLTRFKSNENILYFSGNTIIADKRGNILVYSLKKKKVIFKYNFYKKQYKKIKKEIKILLEENIIYVADNLGYLYSLNYQSGKLLWAKNFKVPFRSNIKASNEKLFLADINNNLLIINKNNGDKLKEIPTEDVTLKNNFINSIALKDNNIIYLNTYGSIYSVKDDGALNWFINLNQSLDDKTSMFFSNPILIYDDYIYLSTDYFFYKIDLISGTTLFKIPITSKVKPVISGDSIFLITKDDLLVCINSKKGEILYSIEISTEIAKFLDTKKKEIYIKSLALVNSDLHIFLHNSYVVKFKVTGIIKNINKLPKKINSSPVFVDNSIIYLNKNKLIVLD